MVLVFLLSLGWVSGCGQGDGTSAFGEPPPTGTWYPEPVALRIHPSTRYVQEGDRVWLRTRVELLDALGDPLKYPARFRFELWRSGGVGGSGSLAYVWRFDVLGYAEQDSAYDPVTRCYAFSLTLDDVGAIEDLRRMRLRVYAETADGERLQREMVLRP
ncbi:hypothetical protein Pan265_26890 [Mucisphaera calidilacus]|uniref:Uncharacterized protein n=2 Tax=Mucisphaera calidilacus TaxID=2527982 RepID=A0A518C0Q9_9BACT|nr:hypothetical protein Pan265_26890 [Mucisphaera calidilacus]